MSAKPISCNTIIKLRWQAAGLVLLGLILIPSATRASVEIRYSLTEVSPQVYQYGYYLFNDGSLPGGSAITGFQILFPDAANLTVQSDSGLASDWDQQIFQAALTDPPAFDAAAFGAGIPAGTGLGGFALQFTYLASGMPGAQDFEIYDADTFAILQNGVTTPLPTTTPMPAPPAVALLLSAFLGRAGWSSVCRNFRKL